MSPGRATHLRSAHRPQVFAYGVPLAEIADLPDSWFEPLDTMLSGFRLVCLANEGLEVEIDHIVRGQDGYLQVMLRFVSSTSRQGGPEPEDDAAFESAIREMRELFFAARRQCGVVDLLG